MEIKVPGTGQHRTGSHYWLLERKGQGEEVAFLDPVRFGTVEKGPLAEDVITQGSSLSQIWYKNRNGVREDILYTLPSRL